MQRKTKPNQGKHTTKKNAKQQKKKGLGNKKETMQGVVSTKNANLKAKKTQTRWQIKAHKKDVNTHKHRILDTCY